MKISEQALREAIKNNNYTLDSFGEKLEMTRQGVYSIWLRKKVAPELLSKICKLLKVTPDDIVESENNDGASKKVTTGNIIYVPLIAYGGFLQGYSTKVFIDKLERFSLPGVTGTHYAFEVDGMSMYDMAAPGDMAIAREEEKLEYMVKGKMYVLQTIDGLILKLFEKFTGDKAIFNSYNETYKPIELPMKSIKRIYFVNRILKKI